MNNDKPRPRPYVWATWVTKLLSGEDRCWWRAWYKAHHKYEKTPDDPERKDFFSQYTSKHDALVVRRAEELRRDGWVVKVEDEGEFVLRGRGGDLAGKPDIVAMRDGGEVLVVDAKAGKRRESDKWQVLLYLWALSLSWLRDAGVRHWAGEVQYAEPPRQEVPPLTAERAEKIGRALQVVTGEESPDAVPSRGECQFCDVAACPVRWVNDDAAGDATRYF